MKEVDWTKWSAVAEIVSSVAILLTLVYLAIQTQQLAFQTEQNTLALQAEVRQAILAADSEFVRQQLDHPNVVSWRSGDGLSDEDLARLNATLIQFARLQESRWLQYQSGAIDERTWLTYRAAIPAFLSTEFVRSWFRNRAARGEFDAEFVEVVEEIFTTNPPDPTRSIRQTLGFDPL
jgi:hypothetical protein